MANILFLPCLRPRLLNSQNQEINLATEALNVSNWVTNVDLPAASAFGDTSPDPDNSRLEVTDCKIEGPSVTARLSIGATSENFILSRTDPDHPGCFRSDFIRLVTDAPDDQVQGL